jgi:hypothetical protein
MVGLVLGIATTVVNPPAAAARAPVAMVSFCSKPGWRRWTCRSTKPGQTIPARVDHLLGGSAGGRLDPTQVLHPPIDEAQAPRAIQVLAGIHQAAVDDP